jgi:hypothetical protein
MHWLALNNILSKPRDNHFDNVSVTYKPGPSSASAPEVPSGAPESLTGFTITFLLSHNAAVFYKKFALISSFAEHRVKLLTLLVP